MKIAHLPLRDDTVDSALEWAVTSRFDAVMVIGWKEGTVSCRSNRLMDFATKVGALELAKHDILTGTIPD